MAGFCEALGESHREKGFSKGQEEGMKQGILSLNYKVAMQMIGMDYPDSEIKEITGFSEKELLQFGKGNDTEQNWQEEYWKAAKQDASLNAERKLKELGDLGITFNNEEKESLLSLWDYFEHCYSEGLLSGYEKGIKEGEKVERKRLANIMLKMKKPYSEIIYFLGLSETELNELI